MFFYTCLCNPENRVILFFLHTEYDILFRYEQVYWEGKGFSGGCQAVYQSMQLIYFSFASGLCLSPSMAWRMAISGLVRIILGPA